MPIIEGPFNAVHLDHMMALRVSEGELLSHTGETIHLTSWAEQYAESASGRGDHSRAAHHRRRNSAGRRS